MKTWHERLNIALKESGLTKAALAKRIGVSAPTVTDWTKGNIATISANNAEKLCRHLGINTTWLLTGLGDMRPVSGVRETIAQPGTYIRKIPLFSWSGAASYFSGTRTIDPEEVELWMPPVGEVGLDAFALRVNNESMVASYPGQRSYPVGTIIYVDPDRPLKNGGRVVALVRGECTFKQYVEDSGRKYLKPINPMFDKIDVDDGVQIIGPVFGSFLPE